MYCIAQGTHIAGTRPYLIHLARGQKSRWHLLAWIPLLESCMGASVQRLSRDSNLINSLGPFSECIKFARAFWFFSFSDKASTHAQTHSQQAPFVC